MSILGKYTENNSLFNFNQNQLKTGMGYIIVYNIHQKSKLLGTVGLRKWENSYLVSRQGWRSGEASHVCGWEILHNIKRSISQHRGHTILWQWKEVWFCFSYLELIRAIKQFTKGNKCSTLAQMTMRNGEGRFLSTTQSECIGYSYQINAVWTVRV